jgi:type II secretory pathway predicted ATPase ExeA
MVAKSTHTIIWIDEADRLQLETLQELRTLAEHHLAQKQLLTIVFSGLPELNNKLEAPALFPLKRRIDYHCVLAGIKRDELDDFILHKFGHNAATRVPASVLDELFERTQATPALIDKVLRHSLSQSSKTIDPEVIRAVLDTYGL